ncbi:MAG: M23 family metallopeptidase, partial [Deltaproteobacteria bacterium]|nr:M23 family metallopeptidase [Deltaproteobacteria bacterium]
MIGNRPNGWGLLALAGVALTTTNSRAGQPEPFEYMPPGVLTPGSGEGRVDETVYAPGMRFPMENGPAFANSQVWGHGGGQGPGGGQCSTENYSYPWWDNYCETRSWDMPLCPAGIGHQGQDIRPATCDDGFHWNVASDAGTVTNIGSYSVYVTAADGTRYDYLHGASNIVSSGQGLDRGERINLVSNEFGGTPTTIHLHFNIRQDVAGLGFVFAPTYMSLVSAYEELFGLVGNGQGAVLLDESDCDAIVGWAQSGDDPEGAATVLLSFDAPHDDPNATVIEVLADRPREELCDTLGSCNHGFEAEVPLLLRDTQTHPVYLYVSGQGGTPVDLDDSPFSFSCDPPPLPDGVRRPLESPEVIAAWSFSPLWQVAWAPAPQLAALDQGLAFPERPVLVTREGGDTRWLMDPGYKRRVDNEDIAAAWGLAWNDAEPWPAEVLDGVPEGSALRPAPFLVTSDDGTIYAIDDAQCPLDDDGQTD